MEQEIWKPIYGYGNIYEISSLGNIRKLDGGSVNVNKGDYKTISVRKHGIVSIHRLVANAFIPNTENKPEVNHINGIKTDNRVENLEWCTRSENVKHAYDTGLLKKAQKVPHIKNKNYFDAFKFGEQLIKLRGEKSLREFGKLLDISAATLGRIEMGNMPDVNSLCKILVYTGWDYSEFITK